MPTYDSLKLENQLCFPLYAAAKEVVRLYTPHLDKIGLTYTQYIAMMVLWQQREMPVKDLGGQLFLDTGTLTPLLKKLEAKGFITRQRDPQDQRSVVVAVSPAGMALRKEALAVPPQIGACIPLSAQDAQALYTLLYKILGQTEP